ncbi:SAM-dependent methyltransferase [Roseofilum sp. Belize Diploria]|uniref:class I SAM-dependent methyltransferase n=1 Tax=Roseofilum sp. Belize Diploria TaxID=2821501 RepID=UPI000E9ED8E1|nr:SAM-dependent methyltransferase [Roseofilum sp. Belize Diploria]MBP0009257.1 class I SAM-dependent methyltransferase [Roseofilum sp. Belize Diploria]HBQ99200.1 SAM-dependent methyltransferase [Cyanobacteria bacterium UBA11691]
MTLTSLPVASLSDTALLTAAYRALESDRPDALFQDPYAQILAGERGQTLVQAMPGGTTGASGCAVRTAVMDELILQIIAAGKVDTVLNLGAGLDTRPYRLPLSATLCWSDCDEPAILNYKVKQLAAIQPRCLLESIALDVTDAVSRQTFFRAVGMVAKQALVITEGLLIYLTPEQVAALATDLYAQSPFHWWLTDLASPHALRYFQNSINSAADSSQATLQFAPAAGTEFFEPYGWRAVESRSLLEEGQRLQREILPPSLLAQLQTPEDWEIWRQMSSFVLLKRY